MGAEHLHDLREAEWRAAAERLDLAGARVLELGAGDGFTASLIARSAEVQAFDLPAVADRPGKLFDVMPFDGEHLPLAQASFDIVFTNSVLEHVARPSALHAEMRRVLKAEGLGVHVVPTGTWRLWTDLAHYLALPREAKHRLFPARGGAPAGTLAGAPTPSRAGPAVWLRRLVLAGRHGEEGNAVSEIWRFSMPAWRRRLERLGWRVVTAWPAGIWYTGYEILGGRLSLAARRRIATVAGSSSAIFVTTAGGDPPARWRGPGASGP